PYDVMDRGMVDELLQQHPRNIVRLILPRLVADPVRTDSPYAQAAKLLTRWVEHRVLCTDPKPALYIYEYGTERHRVCGVVGALELRKRTERTILPHEDVIPDIVSDRLAMMTAAQANLEPILLVYDGAGTASDIIATARDRRPLVDVSASDGTTHRLWSIADPAQQRAMKKRLAPHQALIADGHHRYATYLELRRRHRLAGDTAGPWDRGLALLIDQSQFPLQLGAIHRSISELTFGSLSVPAGFHLTDAKPLGPQGPRSPEKPGEVVLTDGVAERMLRLPAPATGVVIDAEVVHDQLLPRWSVDEHRVGYHHTIAQTLHAAQQDGGIAILLHPPSIDQVMAVARTGKMLPRKSTSFGPKPRTGLVMRRFADEL
ncbi:MAG TPA: DUF1015 domain-containing protein, partial [Pseudonocardiaceae bacterium]|nr:DUF1015 domain-containing protein [Pseudonocardiaceae bacterium]